MEAYFRVAIIYVVLSMAFFIQMDVCFLTNFYGIFWTEGKERNIFFLCMCVSIDNKPPSETKALPSLSFCVEFWFSLLPEIKYVVFQI